MEQPVNTGFVGLGPEVPQPYDARIRLQSPSSRYFGDDGPPAKGEPLHVSLPDSRGGQQAMPDVVQVPAQGYFQALPFGYPLPMPPNIQGTLSPVGSPMGAATFVPASSTVAAPAAASTSQLRNGLQVQIQERQCRRPSGEQLQTSPAATRRAPPRKPAGRQSPAAVGAGAELRAPAAREAELLQVQDDKFTGPSAVFVDLSGLVPKGQGQTSRRQHQTEEQDVHAG